MLGRFLCIAALPLAVVANHLDGPVQDRLDACQKEKCPGSFEYFESMTGPGGIEVKRWITEVDYVNNEVPKMFPDVAKHLECVCQKCTDLVEPIFQPIGSQICGQYGVTFPCKAELDACLAAGYDEAVCSPDVSIMAYKVAYDLANATECHSLCRNADGQNAPPCNKEDALYKLQVCKATSRTNAGDQSIPVTIPCDRSENNGSCEGIPATQCKFCYMEGTNEPCTPESDSRRRRLLFGGAKSGCKCH